MPIYTPPALNAVDFTLEVQPSHSVDPYGMALSIYTVPALNAVDFAFITYTQPVYNTIDFELGVSNAVVNTNTGLLEITGFAPSISKNIFIDLGLLTLTGFSPTIQIGSTGGGGGGGASHGRARRKLSFRSPFGWKN